MKKIKIKIPGWVIVIAVIILAAGLATTFVGASSRFNLPLSWILTPSGTSIDANNDGIVDTERLPFEQGDITSDAATSSWDVDYYDVANLTQGNVKLDVTFGRNATGTLAPGGTAAAGDTCDSETFYSGDSWTQKTGTRVDSDCGYIPSTWSGVCVYKTGDVECPAEYPNKHTRQVCAACTGCTGSCKGCNSCTGSVSSIYLNCWCSSSCGGGITWSGWKSQNVCFGGDYAPCNRSTCKWTTGTCTSCTGSCKGCNSCTGSLTSCTTYTYCCQ